MLISVHNFTFKQGVLGARIPQLLSIAHFCFRLRYPTFAFAQRAAYDGLKVQL
jgi:hypothetical protein